MIRIETRTQLIDYIRKHTPQNAIKRACQEGIVFIIGGFTQIPPFTESGWIVSITSKHGRVWRVAVLQNPNRHDWDVRLIENIPWEFYVGVLEQNISIYGGDDPAYCHLMHKNIHNHVSSSDPAANTDSGKDQSENP